MEEQFPQERSPTLCQQYLGQEPQLKGRSLKPDPSLEDKMSTDEEITEVISEMDWIELEKMPTGGEITELISKVDWTKLDRLLTEGEARSPK